MIIANYQKICKEVFMLKYEKFYEKYLNDEIAKILEYLKQSFIEFYGKSNKNKIEKVFNDLVIVYLVKNYTEQEINKKLSDTENSYRTYLNVLLTKKPILSEFDLIEYSLNINDFKSNKSIEFKERLLNFSYSKLLKKKKINNNSLNIILGMNKGSLLQDFETLFTDYVDYYTKGFSVSETNHSSLIGLRIDKKGKVSLHTLVHEINHQLQKEDLFYVIDNDNKEKIFRVEGLTNNNIDLVNELINEYCSEEIMNIFKRKYNSSLLDWNFFSGYLKIDEVSGNTMKKTYLLLKDEIKSRLINGKARTLRNIIDGDGKENYSLLNIFYNKIKENMLKASNNGMKFNEYISTLSEEKKKGYVQFANGIYISIKNNFETFNKYNIDLNNQVNRMIEEGSARKIK